MAAVKTLLGAAKTVLTAAKMVLAAAKTVLAAAKTVFATAKAVLAALKPSWDIVLSRMKCFEGLVRSQRYQPNQQAEIYNFRVVPRLQVSK